MDIIGEYSFNKGLEFISKHYQSQLEEVKEVIKSIDASECKTKTSREKTMKGKILYSPRRLNEAFADAFASRGWKKERILCEYSTNYYIQKGSISRPAPAFREMDFVTDKLGVEIQFGKYAFMVYNVCAKMTIFHNQGIIDAGIEIVPIKHFADDMSTGVSYFEQIVWDLENRGVSNIDIPVLILGIGA